ncbi:NAD(P)-dependent oxidoreductase [Actinomadura sp. 9N407]|uniref:NAD(P)-dependent oxidoreductase n=1 Tax=Actinomadura sp. 9N407 TaxID=3375154 RepID=UPI0037948E21
MSAAPTVLITTDHLVPGDEVDGLLRDAGLATRHRPMRGVRDRGELIAALEGAVGALIANEPMTAEVFAHAPGLRAVVRTGVGHDSVDVAAATRAGVSVSNLPGVNANAVAEYTMGLILAQARRLVPVAAGVEAGRWPREDGQELRGRTLGLLGYGASARAVVPLAQAFGLSVLCTTGVPPDQRRDASIQFVELPELLARADFLSLHTALTPATRHLIDASALARMKPTAHLVNTARGAIVDETALAGAVRAGRLAGAALDVTATEPLPAESLLRDVPGITVFSHLAGQTAEARRAAGLAGARELIAALRGRPRSSLNAHLLPPGASREPNDHQRDEDDMTSTHAAEDPVPKETVRVLAPTGMLGAGFPPETIDRGVELGADVIAVDGGSTDSGPYYLGSGTPKTTAAAVARDLRFLLRASASAGIPLIVGSCGTSGTDSGVDWVAGIVDRVLREEGLDLAVARIYSEQTAADLKERLNEGRIHPLAPTGELDAATLDDCAHIVGMMGHEPIAAALRAGADVVLAGRATDTAVAAAYPLMNGMPAGPTWHASKIIECGGQCTTNPRTGGVLATIDRRGFTVEPLDPSAACTPTSVAAHMLYETVDPFQMREPAGTLVVTDAVYTALDDRRVRVEGSRFDTADQYTIKLEGARVTGYETMSFVAIRDPHILARIEEWAALMREVLTGRVRQTLDLEPSRYGVDIRLYGYNAVLEGIDPATGPPREVGVMMLVNAPDQATATAIAKIANPLMLHLPTPDMDHLPSLAFATSPAETERGPAYEFVLHHAVDVDEPTGMFRIETPGSASHA